VNYVSGAGAKVAIEIALTQQSIYRKPSKPFTLWNPDGKIDYSEARAIVPHGPDLFELDEMLELRDQGSNTVLVDRDEGETHRVPVCVDVAVALDGAVSAEDFSVSHTTVRL
jgi:hypothetical protein